MGHKAAKKLKILYVKASNLFEQSRLKLRDNISERPLAIIGEVHENRDTGSKLDKFFLNW